VRRSIQSRIGGGNSQLYKSGCVDLKKDLDEDTALTTVWSAAGILALSQPLNTNKPEI